MDAHHLAIAESCLNSAYDGSMPFPEIVGALMAGGFEGYLVDYRRGATTYYHPSQGSAVFDNHPSADPVASEFNAAGVAAQVKWAQANPPDYSYAAFCKNVKAAGCAGYMVSFPGRRVVYYGRDGETHVEHFPR